MAELVRAVEREPWWFPLPPLPPTYHVCAERRCYDAMPGDPEYGKQRALQVRAYEHDLRQAQEMFERPPAFAASYQRGIQLLESLLSPAQLDEFRSTGTIIEGADAIQLSPRPPGDGNGNRPCYSTFGCVHLGYATGFCTPDHAIALLLAARHNPEELAHGRSRYERPGVRGGYEIVDLGGRVLNPRF